MKTPIHTAALCLLLLAGSLASAQDSGIEDLRRTGKAFAAVAQAVSPAVVFIRIEGTREVQSPFRGPNPFDDEFFRRFFGQPFQQPQQPQPRSRQVIGQGSGFVFATEDGLMEDKAYILTNNHVVENAERIIVQFQDGREFDAKVTGTDPQSDVAVIEIPSADVPTLKLGDSDALEVGEWVVAMGNPFGLSHTLTVGVVSATGRTAVGITDYEDFIQTDAAINPGNSGGPLVNLDSEVVGINSAIFSRSGGYMGIGFAIPINLARNIANQLIDTGEVSRGFLGITIQPLTADLAEAFGLDIHQGIVVAEVVEDSPADRAGIQAGDVIVELNGDPVRNPGEFRNHIAMTPVGKTVELVVLRDGKRKTLRAKVDKLGDQFAAAGSAERVEAEIGISVQNMTPELAAQVGGEPGEGVVITDVQRGSVAASAGLAPGNVILQANGKRIRNVEEFDAAIAESRKSKRMVLLVRGRGGQRFIALSW